MRIECASPDIRLIKYFLNSYIVEMLFFQQSVDNSRSSSTRFCRIWSQHLFLCLCPEDTWRCKDKRLLCSRPVHWRYPVPAYLPGDPWNLVCSRTALNDPGCLAFLPGQTAQRIPEQVYEPVKFILRCQDAVFLVFHMTDRQRIPLPVIFPSVLKEYSISICDETQHCQFDNFCSAHLTSSLLFLWSRQF